MCRCLPWLRPVWDSPIRRLQVSNALLKLGQIRSVICLCFCVARDRLSFLEFLRTQKLGLQIPDPIIDILLRLRLRRDKHVIHILVPFGLQALTLVRSIGAAGVIREFFLNRLEAVANAFLLLLERGLNVGVGMVSESPDDAADTLESLTRAVDALAFDFHVAVDCVRVPELRRHVRCGCPTGKSCLRLPW